MATVSTAVAAVAHRRDMADALPTDLAGSLTREWQHIAHRPRHIARAHTWQIAHVEFEDLDELLVKAGYRARPTIAAGDANAVLAAIVVAARHDPLAGRVVLQRILPGLLAASRRWRHGCAAAGVTPSERLGELVGAAWTVIASYPTSRRPHNIAANVLSDTVYRSFVAPSRRKRAGECPYDPLHFAFVPDAGRRPSAVEVVEVLLAAEEAGVDSRHVALLRDLIRAGGSAELVAAARSLTSRTIRAQRVKAINSVRAAMLAA